MKYAARIFLVFLVIYLISEISYQATADGLEKKKLTAGVPVSYLKELDHSEIRLETGAKLIFKTGDPVVDVQKQMKISPADIAGMDQIQFQQYLDDYMLPEEMVSAGLTVLDVTSFERHKVIISVSCETPETMRYQYWCIVKDGVIRVYDSRKKQLVLEQVFVRSRFSLSERRILEEGVYLRDYKELTALLGRQSISEISITEDKRWQKRKLLLSERVHPE